MKQISFESIQDQLLTALSEGEPFFFEMANARGTRFGVLISANEVGCVAIHILEDDATPEELAEVDATLEQLLDGEVVFAVETTGKSPDQIGRTVRAAMGGGVG